jgi:hypothetical protein
VEQVSLEDQNQINLLAVADLDKQLNLQAVGLVYSEHQNQLNQLNHLVIALVNLLLKMELNQFYQAQQTLSLS